MEWNKIIKNIETTPARSAWAKGVKEYAAELAITAAEIAADEGIEPHTRGELQAIALNGARDWREYSYGGCTLIYDADIAERLCTPSELRRVKGGELNPNSRETWLDTQARALYQAFNMLWTAANAVTD